MRVSRRISLYHGRVNIILATCFSCKTMTLRLKHVLWVVLIVAVLGIIYLSRKKSSSPDSNAKDQLLKFDTSQINVNHVDPIQPGASDAKKVEEAKTHFEVKNAEVKKTEPIQTVSANTDWWQAAALMNWFFRGGVDYRCGSIDPMGSYHICQSSIYKMPNPCLVYSFGVANDFAMDGKFGYRMNCEVHSFDPSMLRDDFQFSKWVMFHNMGISSKDQDAHVPKRDMYVKEEQRWKMRTLKSIMKELGHENRVIDLLKLDIMGHEWDVMHNIIDDGMVPKIRQFSVEWYLTETMPPKDTYWHAYETFKKMTNNGIKSYRKLIRSYDFDPVAFDVHVTMNSVNTNFKG